MGALKPGDKIKLNVKMLFGDYERRDATVSGVSYSSTGEKLYEVEGCLYLQGGDSWQISNAWRDRFYALPVGHDPGRKYFTRT